MAAPGRTAVRARVLAHALGLRVVRGPRTRPGEVRRVLVAHHLLAGDVLMLTPLLAKLRERHPAAQIVMTVRRALAPLYAGRPYGVDAVPVDPRDGAALDALLEDRGFDLALVPGDNRYSWLAAALDAAWIVAFAGDRPAPKSWMVDELRRYPEQAMAWADMNTLLVDGPAPKRYDPSAWPLPPVVPFGRPSGRYAVLHVEASTALRRWENTRWFEVANAIAGKGIAPVWSAGPAGLPLIQQIDPEQRFMALGHKLDLAQIWHLVAGAALLVCVDTSVSHIGKLTGTPTVTLYGPGSSTLFGKGEFWRDAPFAGVEIADFPCRDQRTLFKRELAWVRRCQRSTAECAAPRCMQVLGVGEVLRAADEMLRAGVRQPLQVP